MKPTTKAHLAVLATNIFFAINYSLVKFISPSLIGPYALNVVRAGVTALLFWLLWFGNRRSTGIQQKHIGRFILCGIMGVALNQMLFIKGLTMTSTIHAALLTLCTPLLITLFAFWVLKEKLTVVKALGLALGIGGAALLIMSKEGAGASSWTGDLLIIFNAISYAIYFILVKPLMNIYSPVHIVRWVFTIGFLIILPFGWTQFQSTDWRLFDIGSVAALASIVIPGTFLAYLFNVYGIRYLGAGITGTYIYTQPVFAAIIAAIYLHESFTVQKIIAGLLIFAGVFFVSRK